MSPRFTLFVFILFLALIQAVDKNKFKKCDQESWCKRQRNMRSDQVHYEIDSDLGSTFSTVHLKEGSVYASVTERFSRVRYTLRVDLYENEVVRLRIDEAAPLNGKQRYSPRDVLLESLKRVDIRNIKEDGVYIAFDISGSKSFRFTNRLRFELLDSGLVVQTGNARGLFHMEHLRVQQSEPAAQEQPEGVASAATDASTDFLNLVPGPATPIDMSNAWSESFGGETDNPKHGPQSVGMDFTFAASHVYGIPMHATDLSLKSTTGENAGYSEPYRMYNLDVFEYELNEPMALYGHVPMMIGHSERATTGIYWHNAAETWIDVDKTNAAETRTHWFSETGLLDVFILSGPSPRDIFIQFTGLVGTQALPPTFAIAYHQCRWNYIDEDDVRNVNAKFEEYNFPMDVMWLDIEHTNEKRYFTWDGAHFPNPSRLLDHMSSYGRKMVTIVDPHMKRDSGWRTHQEASAGRYYVQNDNGGEYDGICWSGSSSWIDYTNPEARKWWSSKFAYNQYEGSTADLFVWNDMNEPSVFSGPETTMKKNAIHHDGWEHRDVHNVYGAMMQRATSEGLVQRNTWCQGNLRPFVLSRAFFAGSQRWGAIWTGDNKADWGHLAAAQPMLLSSGLGGITFIGADVGGFFGNPSSDLLVRWYQAAAYQPFFRAHAHIDSKRREPWLFGDEPLALMRRAVLTRYALLPYIYTLFHKSSIDGIPVMRPLFVEYPKDQNAFAVQDTFLLGRDLLVTPVTRENANDVTVYFPHGVWYDVDTNERVSHGGKPVTVQAPLNKIPVYQRGGSIIPRKLRIRRSSTQMANDPITLSIALDAKLEHATCDIYLDDGKTYDYAKGLYAYRRISYVHVPGEEIARITCQPAEYGLGSDPSLGGHLSPVNLVERIVIVGQKKNPTAVTLFTSEKDITGNPVEFEVNAMDGHAIVLKKPNCPIVGNWRIDVQY